MAQNARGTAAPVLHARMSARDCMCLSRCILSSLEQEKSKRSCFARSSGARTGNTAGNHLSRVTAAGLDVLALLATYTLCTTNPNRIVLCSLTA